MSQMLSAEAKQEIGEVLVRYASGIDRRDWELFRSCFSDDCVADYGELGKWQSGDELTEWMRNSHAGLGDTLHRITNVSVEADGARVTARSYVDALILGPGNVGGFHSMGYYDDQLIQMQEGWRIAYRVFTGFRHQVIASSSEPLRGPNGS